MQIQTFSVVAGSAACNARCPFCVARMTGLELDNREPEVNWRNFRKACNFAKMKGVDTVLITGKGEPTLFPQQMTKYLERLESWDFPFIELQTNGKQIATNDFNRHLVDWYDYGLSTIALSIVHYKAERNQEVYQLAGGYLDLPALIEKLHHYRFSVRLTLMMFDGFIDSPETLVEMIEFCLAHKVEQLTIRPIEKPSAAEDQEAFQFVKDKGLSKEQKQWIAHFLEEKAKLQWTLPHGALVYDFCGQNICLTNCLTISPETNDLRQIIFFPDGHLRANWQYKGAIIL